MVQLIKVTQVTSAIKRPASRSQRTRFPFDHLDIPKKKKQIQTHQHYMKKCNNNKLKCIRTTYFCVTEEGIENLPHKNDWTQQQIGNPNPQNTWRQPVCQLEPVTSSLVLWFQAPLILKQRTYRASKGKKYAMIINLDTYKNPIFTKDTQLSHTWAPEEDEFKVVFETSRVEHILPKNRKSKPHRQEWFIYHGNLEEYREKKKRCAFLWFPLSQMAC